MISETNFESESGQLVLVRVAKIVKFGSHVTTKKGNQLTCANEKGSHLLTCLNVDVHLRRQMLGARLSEKRKNLIIFSFQWPIIFLSILLKRCQGKA